jgi:predicted nucleic acid-binding protein
MSADFLDSNVLVYLFDDVAPRKPLIARKLVQAALVQKSACISFHVVQETLNVITRTLATPVKADDAHAFLGHVLMPLCRVMPSERLYQHAIELQSRFSISFYDALIVAAALEAGCSRLLTEDLQHGQRIESLRIENPFKS